MHLSTLWPFIPKLYYNISIWYIPRSFPIPSLNTLYHSVFELCCGQTDRQTNKQTDGANKTSYPRRGYLGYIDTKQDWRLTNVRRQKPDSCQLSEPDRNITCSLTGVVHQRSVGAVGQQEPYDLHVTLASRFITHTHDTCARRATVFR